MTIYIETFLLQNTLINLCLLKLVNTTTKYHTTLFKLTMTSLIGAVFSVISAMFLTNNHLLNLLKIICAIVMLKSAFKLNKKQLFISFVLLFVFTYSLGGAIISLSSASYLTSFGVVISSKFNLTFICFIISQQINFFNCAKSVLHRLCARRLQADRCRRWGVCRRCYQAACPQFPLQ